MIRLSIIIFLLSGMTIAFSQERWKNEVDSLPVYVEKFSKYSQEDKKEDAISYGLKILDVWERNQFQKDSTYCNFCFIVSGLFNSLGDYDRSLSILDRILPTVKEVFGENTTEFASVLNSIAICYSNLHNCNEALEYGKKASVIIRNVMGHDHLDYARSLDNLADYNIGLNKYKDAILLKNEAVEIRKKVLGTNHPDYIESLSELADYYSANGNDSEAIRLGIEVRNLNHRILGDNHPLEDIGSAPDSLIDKYDRSHLIIKQIDEAIHNNDIPKVCQLQNELILLADQTDDPDFSFTMYDIAINKFLAVGCYQEAIELSGKSLKKAKDHYGDKHKEVASFLSLLALSNAYVGQIKQAIMYGEQSVQMYEDLLLFKEESYLQAVMLLSEYYGKNEEATKCIVLMRKALSFIEKNNVNSFALSVIYDSLISNYIRLGNIQFALDYCIKRLDLFDSESRVSLEYLQLKGLLAWLHSENGDNSNAIKLIDEVCQVVKGKYSEIQEAIFLTKKSSILLNSNDIIDAFDALKCAEQSVKVFEKLHETDKDEYIQSLKVLASAYDKTFYIDESKEVNRKFFNILKEKVDTSSASQLKSLAQSAFVAGYWLESIHYYDLLASRILQEKGRYCFEYADIELQLSLSYSMLHDSNKVVSLLQEALPVMRQTIVETLSTLSEGERSYYWNQFNYIFHEIIPQMGHETNNTSLLKLMYDAILFSKGLLLSVETSKRISNDAEIADKELHNRLNIKWEDIQKCLNENEIAIEFYKMPDEYYIALSIRKDSEYPKVTHLLTEGHIRNASDTVFYVCEDLTDVIWKPLLPELKGIKTIYFSPSGSIHRMGIEYLPGMEDYNIYRLSSTRELVTGGKTETKNRAVLYGGLRYDAGFDKSVTGKSIAILDEAFKERANVRGMGLRGGKEYLKHTKEEVDIIGEELGKLNWECVIDSAAMGTEESFKALSGRKIGCLHISTHGFYYTQEDVDNARYKFMLIDNDVVSAEDKALTRSGLVMSGANHILEDEKLPDNVEDGILTAKEIADVDLRGLDLVVLSACQTGLGDIAQGEGVFGLQRGFKKAGANSILMSLWEVDDKATQILMTQFYKNLVSGQSKRMSLLSAQKFLRKVEGGKYNEPKYWAAFILLDGIN